MQGTHLMDNQKREPIRAGLKRALRDETGAAAIEYTVLAAIIVLFAAVVLPRLYDYFF